VIQAAIHTYTHTHTQTKAYGSRYTAIAIQRTNTGQMPGITQALEPCMAKPPGGGASNPPQVSQIEAAEPTVPQ